MSSGLERINRLKGSYWLTRIVYVRFHAFILFVAFAVAFTQNEHLIGDNGLTPAKNYIDKLRARITVTESRMDSRFQLFIQHPTIFWFLIANTANLNAVAGAGLILASIVFLLGQSNLLLNSLIWVLYISIVQVGQTWYSFGWVRFCWCCSYPDS